jgi:hypothetical protein
MIRLLWEKMMKWGWDYNREPSINKRQTVSVCGYDQDELDLPNPLTFRVQQAEGGTIVEVRWYDRKTTEIVNKMHVIPTGADVADHVGKIVIMEMLRR